MPQPRPLRPFERTLVGKFERKPGGQPGLADRLRQLHTKFGARSRRVFLVWVRWTGHTAGEGHAEVVREVELLPTPKVDALGVTFNPYSGGELPVGTLRLSEVSAALPMDTLLGRLIPGEGVPPQEYEFFYEVAEDGRSQNANGQPVPPLRERYRVLGEPVRRETRVQWELLLERASEDRTRDGEVNEDGVDPDEY